MVLTQKTNVGIQASVPAYQCVPFVGFRLVLFQVSIIYERYEFRFLGTFGYNSGVEKESLAAW
jgi:hypothetical protein